MKKNINVLSIAIGILVFLVLILVIILFNRDNNQSTNVPELALIEEHIEVLKNNKVSIRVVVSNVNNPYITWVSSDPDVASVDLNGIVTAHKEGLAIITAEYKHNDGTKYSDSCVVNVIIDSNGEVTDVKFIGDDLVISSGIQMNLDPIISPSTASYEKIVYSSSDSSVVDVDNNGLLTGKNIGSATVKVTINGKYSDEINVNVVGESGIKDYFTLPYQLSFESNTMSMMVNDVNNLDYLVSPKEATKRFLTWESSNSSVVSVSNGFLKALSIGETTITVKSLNGVFAKINVNVVSDKISVVDVSLTANETELKKGDTLQLGYRVYPTNASNKQVKFSSSDENVATVSESGLITTKSIGDTNISITTIDGNHTRVVSIKVVSSSSGGSAVCSDGNGPKPNGVCSGAPTLTWNGRTLSNEEKITINAGETITLKVTLPTNNGQPTLLTRTSASGESGWNEYFNAYSSPSVNRYNCATAVSVSSYDWVITAKKATSRYIELSQTAEMQTTQCSFVKPMISVLIKVN